MAAMIEVTFVNSDGTKQTVSGDGGASVMEVALGNGVRGILADCGGALSCATCHVHVSPEWVDSVGRPSEAEAEMLEMAVDPDDTSRLCCQIKLTEELSGLVVRVPQSQL